MRIVSNGQEFVVDILMVHQGRREWKHRLNRMRGVVAGVCSLRKRGTVTRHLFLK
jgi:hypothetical protein